MSAPGLAPDPRAIHDALEDIFLTDDSITELRALETGRTRTISGYFDRAHVDAAVEATLGITKTAAPASYGMLNPVNPALLARAMNRVKPYAQVTTQDQHILRRRWLPLDFDANRPKGISSTDDEHDQALAAARGIRQWLRDRGVPPDAIILADSGNGAHLLVRIDLPNDDAATQLVARVLAVIAAVVTTEWPGVTLDQSVKNAARIWKVYGTPVRKGDSTPERPHRLSSILEQPGQVVVCPRPVLESLSPRPPDEATPRPASPGGPARPFDARAFLLKHDVEILREKREPNGRLLEIQCVWNAEHTRGEAWVWIPDDGPVTAGCHHESCRGKQWKELRDALGDPARRPAAADWPELVPLDGPEVPPFPTDALPAVLADMVCDVAAVTQVPPDLPALAGLTYVGALGSRRVDVAVGRTHVESVNSYTACVAESGTRKGPGQRAMSDPLREIEAQLRKNEEARIKKARARWEGDTQRYEQLLKQAAKEEDATQRQTLTDQAAQLVLAMTPVPAVPTFVVSDRTTERLEMDLAAQGGALLLEDEEAGTLFAIMTGRYHGDGGMNFDVYLKAYDGGVIDVARVGRDPVRVRSPSLSCFITPQPGLLQSLRTRPEFIDRGLLPRFAFAVPSSLVGGRQYQFAASPDAGVRSAYAAMMWRLQNHLPPRAEDGAELAHLRIEGAALEVWAAYHDRIERECADGGRFAGAREWASKQAGRVAKLAGQLHLVQTIGAGRALTWSIPVETIHAACRIGEYLEAHAFAAFDVMQVPTALEGARRLLAWMRRRVVSADSAVPFVRFSAQSAFSALDRRRFATMDDLTPCLQLQVAHGYLRPLPPPPHPGPGRKPSPSFEIRPGCVGNTPQNTQNQGSQPVEGKSAYSTERSLRIPDEAKGNSADSVDTTPAIRTESEGIVDPPPERKPGSDDDDPVALDEREIVTTGSWQVCTRCGGQRWWPAPGGDRCVRCEPPTDPDDDDWEEV